MAAEEDGEARPEQPSLFIVGADVTRDPEGRILYMTRPDGIAVLQVTGMLIKGDSKYGGSSTIRLRHAVRRAKEDPAVQGGILQIDSPGGTIAGVSDLADDLADFNREKPLWAFIEDLGASAAYWLASQAGRIAANRTAEVGSIGVYCVVEDLSGAAEAAGIKVHVIGSGPYKGLGVEGTPITDEHLAYLQASVDDAFAHFTADVKRGRGRRLGADRLAESADGRVFPAADAKARGLIDAVESLDDTVAALAKEIQAQAGNRRRRAEVQKLKENLASR